jgi:hypothetical protein
MHGFKEKYFTRYRIIQEYEVKLVSGTKQIKNLYKDSRSAAKIVQTIKEHKVILTNCKAFTRTLYQRSSNILKTNRMFAEDTKYVKEYKIEQQRNQQEKLKLYKNPPKDFKENRIFSGEKYYLQKYKIEGVGCPKTKTKLYENSTERKLEDINNVLRNIEDLKPFKLKVHLKELIGFVPKFKKVQLQKKLSLVLNERRNSLLSRLHAKASEPSNCPKCPSVMNHFHDSRQLIEFTAGYIGGWKCDTCGRKSRENDSLFPMNHCSYCGYDDCKFCIPEYRRKIKRTLKKVADEHDTTNDKKETTYMWKQRAKIEEQNLLLNELLELATKLHSEEELVELQNEKNKILNEKNTIFNETMKKLSKMEHVGRLIQIEQQHFGDDVYMTQNGYFLHSPVGSERTLLEVESVIYSFEYKDKTYKLSKILGCTLIYTPDKQLKYEEKICFTYSVTMLGLKLPNVGDIVVVGELPAISILVKFESIWKEKNLPHENFNNSTTVFWNRETRKNLYEKMQAQVSKICFDK